MAEILIKIYVVGILVFLIAMGLWSLYGMVGNNKEFILALILNIWIVPCLLVIKGLVKIANWKVNRFFDSNDGYYKVRYRKIYGCNSMYSDLTLKDALKILFSRLDKEELQRQREIDQENIKNKEELNKRKDVIK